MYTVPRWEGRDMCIQFPRVNNRLMRRADASRLEPSELRYT